MVRNKKSQNGAAIVEYTIVTMTVMAMLFLPLPVAVGGDGRTSVAQMLVEAIRSNYSGFLWAMGVPI